VLDFPYPARELAGREIDRDPVCRRMAPEDRVTLLQGAWAFGRDQGARWTSPEGPGLALAVASAGADVEEDDRSLADWGGFVSEYDPRRALIILHGGALRQWHESTGIDVGVAREIALAHELFHHLERAGGLAPWDRLVIPVERIAGLIPVRRRPRGVLEACAHAFASGVVDPTLSEPGGEGDQ